MLAVSWSILHAMTGLTIRFSFLLKVLCLSFARLGLVYAWTSHVSDHLIVMEVATIMLLNRTIKYKQFSSHAVKFGIPVAKWT